MNDNADNALASLWERYRAAAFATGEDSPESILALDSVAQHLRTKRHFSCAVCILEVAQTRCSMRYGPTADSTVQQIKHLMVAYVETGDLDNISTGCSALTALVIQMTNVHGADHPLTTRLAGLCEAAKAEAEKRKAQVLGVRTAIKSHEDWMANRSEDELRAEVGNENYEMRDAMYQDNVRALEMDRDGDVCQQPGQCKADNFADVFRQMMIV